MSANEKASDAGAPVTDETSSTNSSQTHAQQPQAAHHHHHLEDPLQAKLNAVHEKDAGAAALTSDTSSPKGEDSSGHDGHLVSKRDDGKIELDEYNAWDETAYAWSGAKKWYVLTVIFAVQVSMNFNSESAVRKCEFFDSLG